MPTIHFTGKVLPSIVKVTVDSGRQLNWSEPNIGLEMKITLHIKDSVVDAECELNRYEDKELATYYMRALDLVRASVDLVSFAMARGLTVFLDTVVKPNGIPSPILLENPLLVPLVTAFRVNADKSCAESNDKMCQLVLTEPPLFMALNDLIVAITLPHHSPVNCARAIEGLRSIITPPGMDRKDGWAVLRDKLRIEKEYLAFITQYSTGPRHGDRAHIPGNICDEIIKRAWIIMNRFLEFRKRGNQPLPESEFPTLSS